MHGHLTLYEWQSPGTSSPALPGHLQALQGAVAAAVVHQDADRGRELDGDARLLCRTVVEGVLEELPLGKLEKFAGTRLLVSQGWGQGQCASLMSVTQARCGATWRPNSCKWRCLPEVILHAAFQWHPIHSVQAQKCTSASAGIRGPCASLNACTAKSKWRHFCDFTSLGGVVTKYKKSSPLSAPRA